MNGLTLVGLAIVVFAAGYLVYGRWLTKTWGIDPTAKTPAVEFEDGQDYAPGLALYGIFASVFLDNWCRSSNRTDYCRYVWLAAGTTLDFDWWRILWCGSGFYRPLCFR